MLLSRCYNKLSFHLPSSAMISLLVYYIFRYKINKKRSTENETSKIPRLKNFFISQILTTAPQISTYLLRSQKIKTFWHKKKKIKFIKYLILCDFHRYFILCQCTHSQVACSVRVRKLGADIRTRYVPHLC